jgi:mannose-1-phosphate guanylyltransferase
MSDHFYALIMAGGGGTRLWPMSRAETPKQLLPLIEEQSMFGVSVERLAPLFPPERIFIVAGHRYLDALQADAPHVPAENFIAEPFGKDSAAAALLGMAHICERDPHATVALLTADHHITDRDGFRHALAQACTLAEEGFIATLGISPSLPSSAFGYIRRGEFLREQGGLRCYRAVEFTEKPDMHKAIRFIRSGEYSWNSGMFIWTAERAFAEFERQQPAMHTLIRSLMPAIGTPEYAARLEQVWNSITKISIDFAVMEKAEKMVVVPIDIGWSDVGSWDALFDVLNLDENGNGFKGSAPERITIDTRNTLVYSDKLVVTIGVEELVIVDTGDALMVCHKDRAQDVKRVVSTLRDSHLETYL